MRTTQPKTNNGYEGLGIVPIKGKRVCDTEHQEQYRSLFSCFLFNQNSYLQAYVREKCVGKVYHI